MFHVQCRNTTIFNAGNCSLVGGTWRLPSFNASQCASIGQACYGRRHFSLKNSSDCSLCREEVRDIYGYYTGTWSNDSLVPLAWKPRAWVSQNQWVEIIPQYKIDDLFRKCASLPLCAVHGSLAHHAAL